jgi:hypothetical protein
LVTRRRPKPRREALPSAAPGAVADASMERWFDEACFEEESSDEEIDVDLEELEPEPQASDERMLKVKRAGYAAIAAITALALIEVIVATLT